MCGVGPSKRLQHPILMCSCVKSIRSFSTAMSLPVSCHSPPPPLTLTACTRDSADSCRKAIMMTPLLLTAVRKFFAPIEPSWSCGGPSSGDHCFWRQLGRRCTLIAITFERSICGTLGTCWTTIYSRGTSGGKPVWYIPT